MNLGMLRGQPRNVIAKLNGMSKGEEHELFERVKPERFEEDGRPLYSVAECREQLEVIRCEPVTSAKSLYQEVKALLDLHGQLLARQEEQVVLEREANEETRQRVFAATTAMQNAVQQPIHLSVREAAKRAGLDSTLVRSWARKGWFQKSLIPGSRGKGKHKKFDPNKIWDDLASIEKRLGRRGRQSSVTRKP